MVTLFGFCFVMLLGQSALTGCSPSSYKATKKSVYYNYLLAFYCLVGNSQWPRHRLQWHCDLQPTVFTWRPQWRHQQSLLNRRRQRLDHHNSRNRLRGNQSLPVQCNRHGPRRWPEAIVQRFGGGDSDGWKWQPATVYWGHIPGIAGGEQCAGGCYSHNDNYWQWCFYWEPAGHMLHHRWIHWCGFDSLYFP